jgi:hypothetical protein
MTRHESHDADSAKGAVEQEAPDQKGNNTRDGQTGQLPHRTENPLIKGNDTDFPEPGENPEHSGERVAPETSRNPEGEHQTQDPGHRQKQNQNDQKEDPLAA